MLRYPILCQISLPWQPGSVVVERFCHHSVASPQLGAEILVILPVQIELWSILSQISLPWQQRLVVLEFIWHHSTA